jgi:citrate synthase
MKIGPDTRPTSAICGSNPDTIIIRGHDLTEELVGQVSFTDHVWLLLTGALPTAAQRTILDAVLVSIAEHGMVPSVQAARLTLAAAPEALQGAVAAGLLGCGSVILGASQDAGNLLNAIVKRAEAVGLDVAARELITERRAAKKALPGYGRPLAMNVSAAIPAVLLDVGYPLLALKGAPLLARTAGLIAHLLEEQTHPIGFVISHAAASAISYDGPAPAGFVADEN